MSAHASLLKPDLRIRRRPRPGVGKRWLVMATLIALVTVMPVVSLIVIAVSSGASESWAHLLSTVLPEATRVTILLMLGVALVTGIVGVVTAWLTASFDFPGRRLFSWALVLPLAVPTYIAAYCVTEFLHFTGPVQTAIRQGFGYASGRDYWFPDVRSLPGAVIILSSVLYPYVFLTVRLVFLMQGRKAADVARTLGSGPGMAFVRVLLPMARPAIAVGVALALMETINDIGAVEFLGVRTLTFSVYSTWLNRGDLAGATQLALAMLVVIVGLVLLERAARRDQRYTLSRDDRASVGRHPLKAGYGLLAGLACALPIAFGFGIPAYILGDYAFRRLDQFTDAALWSALGNTGLVAGAAGLLTVLAAFMTSYGVRLTRSPTLLALVRLGTLGYAIPGTVLAIGILIPLAAFDNALDAVLRNNFGISTGLLLSGSGAAIVYACFVRFMAMGYGAMESGFAKLSPHLDHASRTLGHGPGRTLRTVLLPLMSPALLTGFMLVFVDSVKELSATILLRPFDFETLATFVYASASRSAFEDAAVAALLIVATGILPVLVLTRTILKQAR
ncbi:iron ABC transporter permease [Fulvimarina sp. 2208YS6-2-32]|uniref:Iron ABC transporter permease n=1 Tax=Fulvimarina uroteuthidis TaxID=3098149 RepID=A0ABU5I021_9HYPH|nr:iron ABC transporter permease [Fulvimarina sp. 2208YS6-2-32]MDY8108697.1 iron ABC transporter permease [Fulvimarina sp. 2208YS6-2-32]